MGAPHELGGPGSFGVQRSDLSPPLSRSGSQDLGPEHLRSPGNRAELGQGWAGVVRERAEGQMQWGGGGAEGQEWQGQVTHSGVYQTLNLCR